MGNDSDNNKNCDDNNDKRNNQWQWYFQKRWLWCRNIKNAMKYTMMVMMMMTVMMMKKDGLHIWSYNYLPMFRQQFSHGECIVNVWARDGNSILIKQCIKSRIHAPVTYLITYSCTFWDHNSQRPWKVWCAMYAIREDRISVYLHMCLRFVFQVKWPQLKTHKPSLHRHRRLVGYVIWSPSFLVTPVYELASIVATNVGAKTITIQFYTNASVNGTRILRNRKIL